MEFFLEGEDPHCDHGLGSLVELRFKVPPGTSYSYITIHLIGGQRNCASWASRPQKSVYTLATTRMGDHEVHKGHVLTLVIYIYIYTPDMHPYSTGLPS
jgi:hypothetical protein